MDHPPPYAQPALPPPPPSLQQLSLSRPHPLDLPAVPVDHLSPTDPNSPRHLPALEPTLSNESQPRPENPMDVRRQGSVGHTVQQSPNYSSGIMLQPLRFPLVPDHTPGSLPGKDTVMMDVAASIEDPDDRMAAEALCGLGKINPKPAVPAPVFRSGMETDLTYYRPVQHVRSDSQTDEPEPLLSLLTSSHPWLGGTINSSVSAYSSTKQYTPRFVRSGADFVENTIGTVGRRTGVEGSIRRYLDARRPSHGGHQDPRGSLDGAGERPVLPPAVERKSSVTPSIDSLPAYDTNRSPSYEEATRPGALAQRRPRPAVSRSWSAQLMISTSGLGAALNHASLRSLKFCLTILNQANHHVRYLMDTLKRLLTDYITTSKKARTDSAVEDGDAMQIDSAPASDTIAQQIKRLNDEIWATFKNVVNSISRYTGGALPENASRIVKWQLMSVPGRWHRAVSQTESQQAQQAQATGMSADAPTSVKPAPDEAESSANRMLAFAIEGLDMMDQVSGVVDSTIVSAEKWLDTMGRRKPEDEAGADDKGLPLPVSSGEQPKE